MRDPQISTQLAMRPKMIRRFYEQVTIKNENIISENGNEGKVVFVVCLDGKKLKTPAGKILCLPTHTSARIVADEWESQEDYVNPILMPATRLVNTACDGVAMDSQAIIEDMLKFALNDLLCYRAAAPQELVEKQSEYWDPVLQWSREVLGAHFETGEGIIQIAQPRESIIAINTILRQWRHHIAIAALHVFVNLTGSIILALAVAKKRLSVDEAWEMAHVDENWNISLWGEDRESTCRREQRWKEMEAASLLFFALPDGLSRDM